MNRDELLGRIAKAAAYLQRNDITDEQRRKARIRHNELYEELQKLSEPPQKPVHDERTQGYIDQIDRKSVV